MNRISFRVRARAAVALLLLVVFLTQIAFADSEQSIADQMDANSEAWWVADAAQKAAEAAGDTAAAEAAKQTKDDLHQQNLNLAGQLAGANGSATYNPASGTRSTISS